MREIEKIITIDEESYKITKMDAFSASYLLKFVLEKAMPVIMLAKDIFLPDKSDKKKDPNEADLMEAAVKVIPSVLESVSDDDLRKIMTKCLNTVQKSLPAGYQKVMMGDSFGISGIQYDLKLCLLLCYHVLSFNCEGFFGESGFNFPQMIAGITKSQEP